MRSTRGGVALRIGGALVALILAQAALDGDAGVRRWNELRDELAATRSHIAALESEVGELEREVRLLETGGFALERAIREELGLVRPGQVLLRLPREDFSTARIP